MALFVSGSLKYLTCAGGEKNGSSSSKEESNPASQVRCSGSCHTVDLKQKLQLSWSKWHMIGTVFSLMAELPERTLRSSPIIPDCYEPGTWGFS